MLCRVRPTRRQATALAVGLTLFGGGFSVMFNSLPLAAVFWLAALVVLLWGYWPALQNLRRRRQELRLLLEPVTVGQMALLKVTNRGPNDSFVAQVMSVEGAEPGLVFPWSIEWKEWNGEYREILEGQTQVLYLADVDPMGEHDPMFKNWRPGRFWFRSIRGKIPAWLAGIQRTSDIAEKSLVVCIRIMARSGRKADVHKFELGSVDQRDLPARLSRCQ
jgi:hypothetical protein